MPSKVLPKLAVLLAAYNGQKWIKEQVDSVLEQKNVNVIIFISIDISTDETRKYLVELYCSENRIVILDDVERFGGAAKNFFRLIYDVDFSEFDYVAFADQDDIWYQHKLMRAIGQLKETRSDGYSSNVLAFWENGRQELIIKSQKQCQYDYLFEAAGPGCTYVMTKSLATHIQASIKQNWDAINGLWLHDWFCYAFSRAHGYKWFIDDLPCMLYRQHLSNQIGANIGLRAFFYRLKKVIWGGAMQQALKIAILLGMKDTPFIQKWIKLDRLSYLKLAFYSHECRRKKEDKWLFLIACILVAIIGRGK